MDSSVMRDIPDNGPSGLVPIPAPVAAPTRADAAAERTRRRFAFDPASSPVLVAALAWDAAVSR